MKQVFQTITKVLEITQKIGYCINTMKNKIQHPFMIVKASSEVIIEETYNNGYI